MTMCLVIIKLSDICFDWCTDTGSQEGSCPNPRSSEQKDWPRSCTSSAAVWWMPQDNGHREASHCHHHTTTTDSKYSPDILHWYCTGIVGWVCKVAVIIVCYDVYDILSNNLPLQTPTPSQPTPVRYSHPVGHKIITLTQFKQQIKHLPQVRS